MNERQLRDRIDELEETVRQLREQLFGHPDLLPIEWKLQPAEARMLTALANAPGGYCSKALLHEIISGPEPDTIEQLVSVRMSFLRKKTRHLGIEINVRWGSGFEMPPASRAIVKAAIAARLAA